MKKAETKDRIREALEIREMKQAELVEKTGIDKGQMSSYLAGRYKPKQNNLYLMAEALSVDEAWLMGYDVPMERNNFKDAHDCGDHNKTSSSLLLYNRDEQNLLLHYRKLSTLGKSEALKRVSELSHIPNYQALDTPKTTEFSNVIDLEPIHKTRRSVYTYYQRLASAGTGEYIFDDIPTDTIEAPYMEYADFIIGVKGDSMEPTYYDGDKVYVEKRQVIEIGEIGIFMINNECFIKEAGRNGLISHNKKYRMIPGSEHIICVGRVLGRVDE